MDPRIDEHARVLVEWSTEVKRGDMVVIRATPNSHELAVAVAKHVGKAGGRSVILMDSEEIARAFFDGADDETLQVFPKHYMALAEAADVFIGLSAPVNTKALANVDPKRMMINAKTTRELGEVLDVSQQTASRRISQCVAEGLISRVHTADGMLLQITEKGNEQLMQVMMII